MVTSDPHDQQKTFCEMSASWYWTSPSPKPYVLNFPYSCFGAVSQTILLIWMFSKYDPTLGGISWPFGPILLGRLIPSSEEGFCWYSTQCAITGLGLNSQRSLDTCQSYLRCWLPGCSPHFLQIKLNLQLSSCTSFLVDTPSSNNTRRLYTRTSPDGQYRNQIDYVPCSWKWESPIQSANTWPGADCDSDHELLTAKFRLKLKKVGKTTRYHSGRT